VNLFLHKAFQVNALQAKPFQEKRFKRGKKQKRFGNDPETPSLETLFLKGLSFETLYPKRSS
jgi:hypothetical protein